MKEEYNILKLQRTFKNYAQRFHTEESERIKKLEDQGEVYPFDSFNISEALYVICKEINHLKR